MDYTTEEAAALLNIKPVTVRAHIARGNLEARLKGRDYLISQDEIERFKREKRKAGNPRRKEEDSQGVG